MVAYGARRLLYAALFGFFVPLALGSCAFFEKDSSSSSVVDVNIGYDSNNPVTKLETQTDVSRVRVSGLSGQSVFLLKCNLSPNNAAKGSTGMIDASTITTNRFASDTPSGTDIAAMVFDQTAQSLPTGTPSATFGSVTRLEHTHALNFAAARAARGTTLNIADSIVKDDIALYETYASNSKVGSTHEFTVEGPVDANGNQYWKTITATLRGVGTHCLVWVAKDNDSSSSVKTDNMVNADQVNTLVANFDKLYGPETAILGKPYGDDGSKHINILVFDINGDYSANQTSGVVGYFWAKDLFSNSFFGTPDMSEPVSSANLFSNKAEIFYLDAYFMDQYPYTAYSTLAHEFQHMIGFNQKNVLLNLANSMPTWYDEMLSMVTEDMLDEQVLNIKITDQDHPIAGRIPYFNYYYRGTGLTYWSNDDSDAIYAYPYAFAFGAYLTRNYGGANLVKKLMESSTVGIASVTDALSALGSSDDFNAAFLKFGQTLVFNSASTPSSVASFNRAPASYSVMGKDGTTYTYSFTPFDIGTLPNGSSQKFGPSISVSSENMLYGYGFSVESCNALIGVSGTATFDIEPPTDPDVALYIMVR